MNKKLFGNKFISVKEDSSIYLDKLKAQKLIDKYGTPSFFFLKQKIIQNIEIFQNAAASVFEDSLTFYSAKANFLKEVLQTVSENNISFEIVSEVEYSFIKKYGCNSDEMLIGGTYLSNELISMGFKEKHPIFMVYSYANLERLSKIVLKNDVKECDVILRIKSPKPNSHLGFSVDNKSIEELGNKIDSLNKIKVIGLLSHFGTQINTNDKYLANIKNLVDFAKRFQKKTNTKLKYFNLGGGFPIASSFNRQKLIVVFKKIKSYLDESGFGYIIPMFEPGRHLIGDAGVCITKIIDISKDQQSLYVDSGNHILPKFAKNALRFYNINKNVKNYNFPVNIYGIIPSEQDVLIKNYNFNANNNVGDHILVINCGSYSLTFSTRFPFKHPKIVWIDGENHKYMEFNL